MRFVIPSRKHLDVIDVGAQFELAIVAAALFTQRGMVVQFFGDAVDGWVTTALSEVEEDGVSGFAFDAQVAINNSSLRFTYVVREKDLAELQALMVTVTYEMGIAPSLN